MRRQVPYCRGSFPQFCCLAVLDIEDPGSITGPAVAFFPGGRPHGGFPRLPQRFVNGVRGYMPDELKGC